MKSRLEDIVCEKGEFLHGSPVPNIKRLKPSETGMLGFGVYLTADRDAAVNYASCSTKDLPKRLQKPTVYYIETPALRLFDVQKKDTSLFKGFGKDLLKKASSEGDPDYVNLGRLLAETKNAGINQINRALSNPKLARRFAEYMARRGYDGLMCSATEQYAIFDPDKTKIVGKETIKAVPVSGYL